MIRYNNLNVFEKNVPGYFADVLLCAATSTLTVPPTCEFTIDVFSTSLPPSVLCTNPKSPVVVINVLISSAFL